VKEVTSKLADAAAVICLVSLKLLYDELRKKRKCYVLTGSVGIYLETASNLGKIRFE